MIELNKLKLTYKLKLFVYVVTIFKLQLQKTKISKFYAD